MGRHYGNQADTMMTWHSEDRLDLYAGAKEQES